MTSGDRRGSYLRLASIAASVLLAGCSATASLACMAGPGRAVPEDVPETSGAAWSRRDPGLFWTVNDGPEGILYAVDTLGALRARIPTEGRRLVDVEDLAGGDCGPSYCLYLADTGDNDERRAVVTIYRVEEPALEGGPVSRTAFPVRFPDGPRDVEALMVFPGEQLYLVSKGRSEAPTLYRYPGTLVADTVVVLERLNSMGLGPASFSGRITGATWIPGTTELALIRSYQSLYLYRVMPEGLSGVPGGELTLRHLQEAQGEAVAADGLGRVILTSEAGPLGTRATFRMLRCEIASDQTPRN